ncbi:MAG: Gfo/Idh/MocA family protein, partial [Gaiellaceae bacterium]
MTAVPLGVVGLGFMGSRWARAIFEHPGARLAVVGDVRHELAEDLAERFGARFVADPLEAASDPELVGVPVLAGHILRFEPRYASVAGAIDAGEIGAVQAVRHERIGLVSDQDVLQGRTTVGLYYGVHELDLARWYAGDLEFVFAERSAGVLRTHGYDVDDLYSALLRFRSGAHGTLMVGWSLPAATPGYGRAGVTVIG